MTAHPLRLAATTAACLLLSGCGFGGINSHVLPGAKGSGDSGYEITVELPTAANLVPNSEVKVDDVTVGTVRSIKLDGWHATATVSIENTVSLAPGTTARVGQKSLLGAEYLELSSPTAAGAARLPDGGRIPLARAGNYPETEDVLGALAMLLNGGGLQNIDTIVRELADTLGPTTDQARQLIKGVSRLVSTIAAQRSDVIGLIESSDRLGVRLDRQTRRIARALDALSTGIAAVSRETPALTRALASLRNLSLLGSQVVARDGVHLREDLGAVSRVVRQLVAAGEGLPDSLDLLATVLFPISRVGHVVKGDYLNFAATVDLTLPSLQKGLLPGGTTAQTVALVMSLLGLLPPAPAAPGAAQEQGPPPGADTQGAGQGGEGILGNLGGLVSPEPGAAPAPSLLGGLLGRRAGGR